MKLGISSSEVKGSGAAGLFRNMAAHGFEATQFCFDSLFDAEMPERIPDGLAEEVGRAARENGVTIRGVNGTFNMIHPDTAVVEDGIRRFTRIAASCKALGCDYISLCTGTRNTGHMWRWHDDNRLPDAWADMLKTMERLLVIAEEYDITLGVETEASNVVTTPEKGRLLLDTMKSKRLGIIMDPANLFQPGEAKPELVHTVLEKAFSALGDNIIVAHGKDILASGGDELRFTPVGTGIIDFARFIALLKQSGYTGPLIMHSIFDESLFPMSIAHIQKAMGD